MLNWLKLIRIKNLLLISLSQLLIGSYFFNDLTPQVLLYIISTFCFASAGNIINDIFDVIPDQINKPHKLIIDSKISSKQGILAFYVLNSIGVLVSFILYNRTFSYSLLIILLSIPVLLYMYSKHLKKVALIGNLLIALLASLSVILLLYIYPKSTEQQQTTLFLFSFFAFLINFIRELIKDIEDINGDKKANLKTLPILIGVKRSVLFSKLLIGVALIAFLIFLNLVNSIFNKTFIILALITPMCYCFYLLKTPYTKKLFSKISNILKLVIAFGITAIFLHK